MPSKFQDQLSHIPGKKGRDPKLLPLTHITNWAGFLSIAAAKQFAPTKPCTVYGAHLVYAFYGRPAYRFKDTKLNHNAPSFAPVCFILKPNTIHKAIRIMPFDSGGFAQYKPAMHDLFELNEFELSVQKENPKRLVKSFWKTNKKYFEAKPLPPLAINASHLQLMHYGELISNRLPQTFDLRCSTLEVQIPAPFALQGMVEAIVAPSGVAGTELKKIAKSLNAELLLYGFETPYRVNDFHQMVRGVVRGYLTKGKYLG